MDPLPMILSALTAGAVAALQETATSAIKDGYAGLKSLIQKKFDGKQDAQMVLEKHEQKPDVWEKPLAESLKEAGADQDESIIQAAKSLIDLLNAQNEGGKYNVQIKDAQGVVVGDQARVNMNFGPKEEKSRRK